MSNKFQYQTMSYGDDNRWEIMSKLYFEKLTELIALLEFGEELDADLIVKHFFNGAAAYVNGKICASWSPVGLAFKLPAEEVAGLIAQGQASPLKYFAKSPVKKGYALFADPDSKQNPALKTLFLKAAAQALSVPEENMPEAKRQVYTGARR